jgi:3-deoxy-7-phosphoheptulonate synthase
MPHTSDTRIAGYEPLLSPAALLDELPLDEAGASLVARAREEVRAILDGADDRLLVVVGPCSVHDPVAALDYARRLTTLRPALAADLLIVMRVYFEKPRTVTGWKGLINDPGLDGSYDVHRGLRTARRLLLELARLGLPAGCEWLDPITPQYITDAVTWGAIGARTVESQVHRQLASGLSMPVGFKNATSGDIQVAIDACRAAAEPHRFFGVTRAGAAALVTTTGNTDCHLILRGGRAGPNYQADKVAAALDALAAAGLPRRLMVDASHGNSGKDHRRQPLVAADLAEQVAAGQRGLAGVMLESFLRAGSQPPGDPAGLVYGQSITDGCLDIDTTATVLGELAEAVRQRRKRGAEPASLPSGAAMAGPWPVTAACWSRVAAAAGSPDDCRSANHRHGRPGGGDRRLPARQVASAGPAGGPASHKLGQHGRVVITGPPASRPQRLTVHNPGVDQVLKVACGRRGNADPAQPLDRAQGQHGRQLDPLDPADPLGFILLQPAVAAHRKTAADLTGHSEFQRGHQVVGVAELPARGAPLHGDQPGSVEVPAHGGFHGRAYERGRAGHADLHARMDSRGPARQVLDLKQITRHAAIRLRAQRRSLQERYRVVRPGSVHHRAGDQNDPAHPASGRRGQDRLRSAHVERPAGPVVGVRGQVHVSVHEHVHSGQPPGQGGVPDVGQAPCHPPDLAPVIVDRDHPVYPGRARQPGRNGRPETVGRTGDRDHRLAILAAPAAPPLANRPLCRAQRARSRITWLM